MLRFRMFKHLQRSFCSNKGDLSTSSSSKAYEKFREGVKQHKLKLLVIGGVASIPLFFYPLSEYLQRAKRRSVKSVETNLSKDQELSKIVESFLIRTIIDVLKSPEVVTGGVDYTMEVINNPKLNEELLKFLVNGLKHPVFLDELKVVGKSLTIDILNDKEVQRDLLKLLVVGRVITSDRISRSRASI